jgi:hypothetical protein
MRRLLVLALAALLVAAGTALAVLPHVGAKYAGHNSQGYKVSFSITKHKPRKLTKVNFGKEHGSCLGGQPSETKVLKEPGLIKIKPDGTFSGSLNRFGFPDTEEGGIIVKGKFLPHGKAKGTVRYEDRGCTGLPTIHWTAKVKP